MTKAVLRDIEGEAHNYVLSGSQTAREQPTLWAPRVMHMKGSMEHPIHGYRPKPAHLQDAPRALIHGQNFEEQPRHERWRVSTGMRPSFTFKDNTAFVPCPPTDLLKKDETKKKKKRKPRKGKNPNPADRSVQQNRKPQPKRALHSPSHTGTSQAKRATSRTSFRAWPISLGHATPTCNARKPAGVSYSTRSRRRRNPAPRKGRQLH